MSDEVAMVISVKDRLNDILSHLQHIHPRGNHGDCFDCQVQADLKRAIAEVDRIERLESGIEEAFVAGANWYCEFSKGEQMPWHEKQKAEGWAMDYYKVKGY